VSLWWKRGELWSVDGHFSGLENLSRILDLFFRIPILGIAVAREAVNGTGCPGRVIDVREQELRVVDMGLSIEKFLWTGERFALSRMLTLTTMRLSRKRGHPILLWARPGPTTSSFERTLLLPMYETSSQKLRKSVKSARSSVTRSLSLTTAASESSSKTARTLFYVFSTKKA
jgi:hypothetical protein